jgi:hypothetical protein
MDWVVMRNRLSHINARNKKDIGTLLEQLSKRLRFRIAPGFGERVVFRELFPKGLTLLDLGEATGDVSMSLSHVAARQELRQLMDVLNLPENIETSGGSGDGVVTSVGRKPLTQIEGALANADAGMSAAGTAVLEGVKVAGER